MCRSLEAQWWKSGVYAFCGSRDIAVFLNIFHKMWCFYKTWCFTGRDLEEQLYLVSNATYKHRTFTIVLLRTCTFHWILHHSPRKRLEASTLKIRRNPLFMQLKMTRPDWHSTTSLSAQSSYDNENRVRRSRVMGLPDVAENALRVASEKQHGAASHTIEPPNRGHFGTVASVLSSEVVLFSEVV